MSTRLTNRIIGTASRRLTLGAKVFCAMRTKKIYALLATLVFVPCSFLTGATQRQLDKDDDYAGFTVFRNQLRDAFNGHKGPVREVAFSPDGNWVGSASWDGTVRLWSVGKKAKPIILDGRSVTFSKSGKLVATFDSERQKDDFLGLVKIWDSATGRKLNELKLANQAGSHPHFMVDEKSIAVSNGLKGEIENGKTVYGCKIIEIETGKETAKFLGHIAPVTTLALSPNGKILATGSKDGTARLWNIETKHVTSIDVGLKTIHCLAFSPDGTTLATGSEKVLPQHTNLKLWNVRTGKELSHWQTYALQVNCVQFSPDGKTFCVGGERDIQFWTIADGEVAFMLGSAGPVYSLAYSPNGNMLASGERDPIVKVWDVPASKK